MSRRKIKRRVEKTRSTNQIKFMGGQYPITDPDSGRIEFKSVSWEISEQDLAYMPSYELAHQLMPAPTSPIFDPNAYLKQVPSSIQTLKEATEGTDHKTVLAALGVLGHSPVPAALQALAEFSRHGGSLAPVARLALAECAGIQSSLGRAPRAA
jgi:hypothetical protein